MYCNQIARASPRWVPNSNGDKLPPCKRCGEELEIRWINGKLVPLHRDNRCLPYSEKARQTAQWVRCRECSERCHLVYHNGGYIMLDELGPPWPKHPCFAERFSTPAAKQLLTRLIDVISNQNAGSTVPGRSFWNDPSSWSRHSSGSSQPWKEFGSCLFRKDNL